MMMDSLVGEVQWWGQGRGPTYDDEGFFGRCDAVVGAGEAAHL